MNEVKIISDFIEECRRDIAHYDNDINVREEIIRDNLDARDKAKVKLNLFENRLKELTQ